MITIRVYVPHSRESNAQPDDTALQQMVTTMADVAALVTNAIITITAGRPTSKPIYMPQYRVGYQTVEDSSSLEFMVDVHLV